MYEKNKLLSIILVFALLIVIILIFLLKYTHNSKEQIKEDKVGKSIEDDRIVSLIEDADHDGEISIGDKYKYRVNDEDTFNFYVLSKEEDKVNLIMDRNICEDGTTNYNESNNFCLYMWYSLDDDNSKGPITALKKLYKATKNWTNVPNINLIYKDEKLNDEDIYGYNEVQIIDGISTIIAKNNDKKIIGEEFNPLKARLPMLNEVVSKEINCEFAVNSSCKSWIVDNLRFKNEYSINKKNKEGTAEYNILGYWLMTSYSKFSGYAYRIYYFGSVGYDFTSMDISNGIRPVITVPVSCFSS